MSLYPKLQSYIEHLQPAVVSIPDSRKETLKRVSEYIRKKLDSGEAAKLNFICTHNSRRSHLAQIWTSVAAYHLGIDNIDTFSGGTEATALNPRAVAALERAGFQIETAGDGGLNPEYRVRFDVSEEPLICFSKTFDHRMNPEREFAAIMTCSDADENCPFVPGAEFRLPVTYRDPKESDGTDEEADVYDERCRQIAAEMFYIMREVNTFARNS